MKRSLLVLLASMFLSVFATQPPSSISHPDRIPSFREVSEDTWSGFQVDLPGKQVRFLPDGIISVAEYHRIGRGEPDLSGPMTSPEHSEYEVMVWNWDWAESGQVTPALDAESGKLIYSNLQPGIDLVYYLTEDHQLKYDFVIQPGAEVERIEASLDGAHFSKVDRKGRLRITTPWGEVRDEAPYSYVNKTNGQEEVASDYHLNSEGRLSFDVAIESLGEEELVIDPLTMSWSTFHHSAQSDDYVIALTRDAANYLYVVGYTETPTFPISAGVYQGSFGGQVDAFVSKLGPNGDYLVWSTFLGGSDWDMAYAIDIDASGKLYVGGYTASIDFPVTSGSAQPFMEGINDAFVVCLNADGSSLAYSTYLGGSDRDYLYDLVVTSAGEAIVTGYTFSGNFPVSAGAFDPTYHGYGDTYLTKISASGQTLVFSTYAGGTGFEMGHSLDEAADGSIAIVGNTNSVDLPLKQPLQSVLNINGSNATDDGFFLRFDQTGSILLNGTYLGGSGSDGLYTVVASDNNEWFMAGNTYSSDLPSTVGVFQPTMQGNGDVFIARMSVSVPALAYLTYLGGSDVDYVKAIRVESDDELYVLGASRSNDWPVTGGLFSHSGQYDAFLTHLTADGAAVNSSTLIGGSYNDYPRSAGALHLQGNLIALAVTTHSPNIQSAGSGYQQSKLNGLADAPWIVGFEGDVLLPPDETRLGARPNGRNRII